MKSLIKPHSVNTVSATAVLVEDEAILRDELRSTLAELWPELKVVGEAANGLEALGLMERLRPDILFLDIQMPGLTGLDVAQHANGRCQVVFVTAYDQYAVAAFEEGAIDYVLKPIVAARLYTAIQRVRQRLLSPPPDISGLLQQLSDNIAPSRNYLRWINASQGANVRLITVDEICYFQADTKYTRVVTADAEALIRKPIKELLEELDPANFWQIHRSTIINVSAIANIGHDLRGRMSIKLKQRRESLLVSQPFTHLFRQM